MRKIQCMDCGKRYDYDVDDFCPRCGSFNPPPDGGATRLEPALLARFRQQDGGGAIPRQIDHGQPKGTHPTWGSGPDLRPGRTHTSRIQDCDACAPVGRRGTKGSNWVILAVIIMVLLGAVVPLIVNLVHGATQYAATVFPDFGQAETSVWTATPAQETEYGSYHEVYETFVMNESQLITVGSPWEPWLSDELLDAYPDTVCVAVSVWIEGTGPSESTVYYPAMLLTEDGTAVQAVDLPSQAEEDLGLDSINLADGRPDQELFGDMFFFLPEETAGQDLMMLLMEDIPGQAEDEPPAGLHLIPLWMEWEG